MNPPDPSRPVGATDTGVPIDLAAAASELFGERLALALDYAALLADTGVRHGLIGPREVPRVWERHLLNCAAASLLLPAEARVLDVGSGAGLPGVVLALCRPDVRVTLLEPMLRRVEFLERCVDRLGLSHVRVVRGRAGDAGAPSGDWGVVTARAVAPLARLAQWTLPMLADRGVLLAVKGRGADAELVAAEPTLRSLGARSWRRLEVGAGQLPVPTTVVEVVAGPGGGRVGAPQRRRP